MALEQGQRIGDRYTLVGRLGSGGMADVWLADDEMLEPPGGAQVPARALRPGRPVRRALPPRGAGRGRAPAPERGRRLRPRRGRGPPLDRDGVRRGGVAQGPDRARAHGRRGGRDHPPGARRGRSSPTSAGSSTATSSRRTCSSTARAAPGSPTSGSPAPAPRRSPRPARCSAPPSTSRPSRRRASRSTATSDLYSIGVMLYEALTGRVPFEADTPVAVALKQISEQPRPPVAAQPAGHRRRSTRSSCGRSPRTRRTASSPPTSSSRALDAAEADPARPATALAGAPVRRGAVEEPERRRAAGWRRRRG